MNNCTVYNLSMDMVNVRCVAGFDGGLVQTFVLEVYEPRTNGLLANMSSTVSESGRRGCLRAKEETA